MRQQRYLLETQIRKAARFGRVSNGLDAENIKCVAIRWYQRNKISFDSQHHCTFLYAISMFCEFIVKMRILTQYFVLQSAIRSMDAAKDAFEAGCRLCVVCVRFISPFLQNTQTKKHLSLNSQNIDIANKSNAKQPISKRRPL